MKNKTHFLLALLVLVTAAGLFLYGKIAGEKENGETAEQEERKQMYVLCSYETKLHQQILNEIASDYSNQSSNAIVNMEYIPKENFKKEICMRMDSGSTADLIICDNGMMPALIDMGVFVDISAHVDEKLRKSMNFPKLWSTTMDDGKYYGVPFTCDPYVFFYNKNILVEKGQAVPKSWDELLEACGRLQELGKDEFGFAAKRPEEIYSFYMNMLNAFGGNLSTVDQEGGLKAAHVIEELRRQRYIGNQTINLTEADVARSFANGDIMMMANRLSASTILRSSWMEFTAGIEEMPYGIKESLILTGENIGVTLHADEEAYDFLTYLFEDDIQERICNAIDTLPVKSSVPYRSKRVGPDDRKAFLRRYMNEGWCAESNNSWFEIAEEVSGNLYSIMEARDVSTEDTLSKMQNNIKLFIMKKR